MANITAYPVGTPKGTDLVVGTQVADPNIDGDTNKTRNFTVKQIAEFANIPSSYTAYAALLTQTGTDAPVATTLYNNTSATFTWTRFGAGVYRVEANTSVFTEDKTAAVFNLGSTNGISTWNRLSDTFLQITSGTTVSDLDDYIRDGYLEIRIYN